jgi:hypothetical protein
LRLKSYTLILSLCVLALVIAGCGKKASPVPKGLPIPAGVGDLRGDVRDGVLLISFSIPKKNQDGTPLNDLAGFRILKSCGGCGGGYEPWKSVAMTDRQGFTTRGGRLYTYDNDLREGFDYGYRVFPFSTKGVTGGGSNTFLISWKEPPGPLRGLTIGEEDSMLVFSWTGRPGLLYNIYRWEDGVYPVSPMNTSPLATPQFVDSGLQNGKQYKYEVRAVRMDRGTAFEGEGTAVSGTPRDKTPPLQPAGPRLERKDTSVFLSWTGNTESDLAGYNVYRVVSGKPTKINNILVVPPHFVDERPGPERYISYYVTAVDKSGNESDGSQEQVIILKE